MSRCQGVNMIHVRGVLVGGLGLLLVSEVYSLSVIVSELTKRQQVKTNRVI